MKSKHERTIDDLVERLLNSGKVFELMKKHVEYKRGRYCGEVDLLVKLKGSEWFHFYEIKSNYSTKNYRKAIEQYARYCKAHPSRKVIGVYVTDGLMMPLQRNLKKK